MREDLPTHSPLLAIIEHIGLSEYPSLSALAYTPPTQPSLRVAIACQAQRSLLLRLLARRPWLGRELCQLQLGHTLQCETGLWRLTLPTRDGGSSRGAGLPPSDRLLFPGDLVQPLEEFLDIWRPILADVNQAALFITRAGLPYTTSALNSEVARVIWRYTRWSVSVPQIRQLWNAEFATTVEIARRLCLVRRHA